MKVINTKRSILIDVTVDGIPILMTADGSTLSVHNHPSLVKEPPGTYVIILRTCDRQPWIVAEVCRQENFKHSLEAFPAEGDTLMNEIQLFYQLTEALVSLGLEELAKAAHWLLAGLPKVRYSD